MITAHHLVFGRKYGGIAYWLVNTNIANPFFDYFGISTKNGNIEIDWKDGTPKTTYITSKNIDSTLSANNSSNVSLLPPHSFPANFIASVELNCLGGLNDVYSLYFGGYGMVINQDFSIFINQFTSLYSINIDIPHYDAYLNGDISQIPNSVEKFYIRDLRNSGNLYLNISNFNINSQLKEFKSIDGYYNHNGFTNIYGDLSKLPPLIKIFTLKDNLANTLTYTSGKVWSSSFDTLDLGNATLSATDTDNLLIDMANSITTAIGSKVIRLANCYRTTASNTAVAYLQSLGFTITVNFAYNDLFYINNVSKFVIQNGTITRTTDHKGGNTAIQFGSGNLVSINNLPASPVWSVAFWVNYKNTTKQAGLFNINDSSSNKLLFMGAHARATNRFTVGSTNSPNANYNEKNILLPNGNTWYHVVVVFDRSIVGHTNEIKFYLNKVLTTSIASTGSTDQIGNFVSGKATIGSNTVGMATSPIKMFNYQLSQTEIDNLYNE